VLAPLQVKAQNLRIAGLARSLRETQQSKYTATEQLSTSLKECEAKLRRVRQSDRLARSCLATAPPPDPYDVLHSAALSTAARASVRSAAAALGAAAADAATDAALEVRQLNHRSLCIPW
jgi:phage-related minor tail protein